MTQTTGPLHGKQPHVDNTIHGIVVGNKSVAVNKSIIDNEREQQAKPRTGQVLIKPTNGSESDAMDYNRKKANLKKSGVTAVSK